MINILIEDSDGFYRHGMEFLLKEILNSRGNDEVVFVYELNSSTIANADIIVKRFLCGDFYICHQDFWHRKKHSLVIGVCDESKKPRYMDLPQCFDDIVFIGRSSLLSEAKRLISRGWEQCQSESEITTYRSCLDCKHRTLSPQQENIAVRFYAGENAKQIANNLHLNLKTVAAHKRLLMIKYNLSSDYELISFLNRLKPSMKNILN